MHRVLEHYIEHNSTQIKMMRGGEAVKLEVLTLDHHDQCLTLYSPHHLSHCLMSLDIDFLNG